MLKNRATAEGTLAYARRHAELPGNFRPMLGALSVSSVGIGTYLGEPDEETDRAYAESIRSALLGGINLVDTAVNYRFQRGERTIGKVLNELVAAGELHREEVVVATKGVTSPSMVRCRPIRGLGSRRSSSIADWSGRASWSKDRIA
jgi:aryl-alcohol dehydrogenase-like predicted oxidoreductase